MKIVEGDLLYMFASREFDVIIHGCNCFHLMGAGIAGQIAKQYPQAYLTDIKSSEKGEKSKLGWWTSCDVNEDNLDQDSQWVINLYTQFYPGRVDPDELYKTINTGFDRLMRTGLLKGKRVGIPVIGGGIAGGDYNKLVEIFKTHSESHGIDLTVVVLPF